MHAVRGWLAAGLVVCAVPAFAHTAPFSHLDLRLDGVTADVTLVLHVPDLAHDLAEADADRLLDPGALETRRAAILSLAAARVRLLADDLPMTAAAWSLEPLPDRHAVRVRARFTAPAGPPGRVTVDALMFSYDPVHQTFVTVYEREPLTAQAILSKDKPRFEYFTGTRQGTMAVIRRFVPAGVHHILIGPDHLLFLVGLLLLGGSLRQIVVVVTAFTAAHSVTLSLAVLGLVNPPARVVEPAIALSIIYVGADNLTVRGGRDVRGWIAFAFGLIHGFGFASVLREMDLPARALGWSLFSFNLGVELGQLLVVIPVAAALAAIRAKSEAAGRRVVVAGSIVVIAAGTYWFIERVFFPGGAA
jgi:hydrogenase/urease accessory protein HupE